MDANRMQVLVVDDDATTRDLIRSILESNGWTCVAASSGAEALDVIRTTPSIQIAISDINMPGMDGISLVRHMHGSADANSPRVIFITANPSVDCAVAALRLGAADFLTKPVRPQVLLSAVRRAVVQAQEARAIAKLREEASRLARQIELLEVALRTVGASG